MPATRWTATVDASPPPVTTPPPSWTGPGPHTVCPSRNARDLAGLVAAKLVTKAHEYAPGPVLMETGRDRARGSPQEAASFLTHPGTRATAHVVSARRRGPRCSPPL
ncbi:MULTISPECIES: hypothetical protein [unclassified Streptomyces]|uniref:hypothetical protein n=1 Tax=unclassified Streptomyces TaxID=2593676 RepID=UPI0033BBDFBF